MSTNKIKLSPTLPDRHRPSGRTRRYEQRCNRRHKGGRWKGGQAEGYGGE